VELRFLFVFCAYLRFPVNLPRASEMLHVEDEGSGGAGEEKETEEFRGRERDGWG
jgi:hypothetical protein